MKYETRENKDKSEHIVQMENEALFLFLGIKSFPAKGTSRFKDNRIWKRRKKK